MKVDRNNPADKWFVSAYDHTLEAVDKLEDGTYEAVGKHFQGNPYGYEDDILVLHGERNVDVEFWNNKPERTFEGLREYLSTHYIEGLVFWKDGEPKCKIKRTDYGIEWPNKH